MQSIDAESLMRDVRAMLGFIVDQHPEISGRDLLDRLDGLIASAEAAVEHAICRCGKKIIKPFGEPKWVHDTRDQERGCRAATFHDEGGWDDSISASWVAVPAKTR